MVRGGGEQEGKKMSDVRLGDGLGCLGERGLKSVGPGEKAGSRAHL